MNKSKLRMAIVKLAAFCFTALILSTGLGLNSVKASKPLDEIVLYSITADVLEDATVDLTYDIEWKVLDSDSEGPLEWVKIGLPNNHVNSIEKLSPNIHNIADQSSYARVDFDRPYKKDEIVKFSFKVNMDYMYQVYPEENCAEYTFTPGWFDGITVDQMILRWNSDKVSKFEPAGCLMEEGYHVWTASLAPNEKFTIEMSYPLDAYGFDLTQHDTDDGSYKYSEHNIIENILFTILCIIIFVVIVLLCSSPILVPVVAGFLIYKASSGFGSSKSKKITRTIIEYYESCPNCGGSREEGKEKCSYCGSNMVKSKTEVKEEDIKKEDRGALKYKSNGEYRFSDNPNRYVRVHVTPISISRSSVSSSRIGSSRSSGVSHHSSCAHSSCACACACACAGGGRAGCSTKDFYNTDMKLSYLEKYKR